MSTLHFTSDYDLLSTAKQQKAIWVKLQRLNSIIEKYINPALSLAGTKKELGIEVNISKETLKPIYRVFETYFDNPSRKLYLPHGNVNSSKELMSFLLGYDFALRSR